MDPISIVSLVGTVSVWEKIDLEEPYNKYNQVLTAAKSIIGMIDKAMLTAETEREKLRLLRLAVSNLKGDTESHQVLLRNMNGHNHTRAVFLRMTSRCGTSLALRNAHNELYL